jgi:hypothetical protein
MKLTTDNRKLWLGAFSQRTVWTRAAKVGLPVGCLQSVINQGDVWWNGQATGLTLTKTLVSPLVTFSVALVAVAGTWVEKQRSATPLAHTSGTNLASPDGFSR